MNTDTMTTSEVPAKDRISVPEGEPVPVGKGSHVYLVDGSGYNDIYPNYKANRPPPPEELIPQFPLIRAAVKAFNIASIEQEGFEADDLIATYAKAAVEAGGDVTIVSSDKDLMQLVKPGIVMLDTMKGNKLIGREEVIEKFGLEPACVVDIQALAGDSTDNAQYCENAVAARKAAISTPKATIRPPCPP